MPAEVRIVDTRKSPNGRGKAGRLRVPDSMEILCERLRAKEPDGVWVVADAGSLRVLVRAVAELSSCATKRGLFSYPRPSGPEFAALGACFRPIVPGAEAGASLPELAAILAEERPRDYCVAVDWDPVAKALTFWRGDLSPLVVPLSFFPRRAGLAPDPHRLSVLDHGQTIGLGGYQSSFDAILYMRDAEYRRHARRRMIESDTSLGGSIRRLRRQKGLRQGDFPHVAEKTIARIEKGISTAPHRRTLRRIAAALGVDVEELREY